MRYSTTAYFDREFKKFSKEVQRAFKKQAQFLLVDIRHPSLRAKKYDETEGIWQARITDNVRLYFRIERDTYQLLHIRRHSK